MLLSVGYLGTHVHDPFWVPSDAPPGKEAQVVGGEAMTQVVGGEVKKGRGHDRDQKRRTKVATLPNCIRPALTSALLAMVTAALTDPSALPTELLTPLGSLEP